LLEVGGISPARIDQTKQEITLAEKDLRNPGGKKFNPVQQLNRKERGCFYKSDAGKRTGRKTESYTENEYHCSFSGIILSISGKEGEKVKTITCWFECRILLHLK
jgi:HlyD family secretion protein